MTRIFCALLAILCLSACGIGKVGPGDTPPQETPLEQEFDSAEQDVQASAAEEALSEPVLPEQAETGGEAPQIQENVAEPPAGAPAASGGTEASHPEQSAPPEKEPTQLEGTPESTEPEETGGSQEESTLKITVGGYELLATFADNSSAEEFRDLLAQGPLTIEMEDYGGFEKVGPLGTSLTRNDSQITTEPGDVILYQGNQITIYYGTNSWSFTRLARINDPSGLQEKLGNGTVSVTFSLG